jgi:hypothetical protein
VEDATMAQQRKRRASVPMWARLLALVLAIPIGWLVLGALVDAGLLPIAIVIALVALVAALLYGALRR